VVQFDVIDLNGGDGVFLAGASGDSVVDCTIEANGAWGIQDARSNNVLCLRCVDQRRRWQHRLLRALLGRVDPRGSIEQAEGAGLRATGGRAPFVHSRGRLIEPLIVPGRDGERGQDGDDGARDLIPARASRGRARVC
jgi:hypothetical protein